jgi:hypothetical protein
MSFTQIRRVAGAGALVLALAAPAAAHAATAPGVSTGGAANVAQQTAQLIGVVNPAGAQTTYQFQYGTTSAYGAVTAPVTITGARRTVTADLAGLAPATTYHYRLIASNAKGQSKGADRTFKTHRQPLGVTFAGNPNPVGYGGSSTLAGQVTGTGNAGLQVVLQSNPFPYTQGFKDLGNPLIADATGSFAFPLLAQTANTQYRVRLPERTSVVSPIVTLNVLVRVSTSVSRTRVRRGSILTFSGKLTPAVDGTLLAVQRKVGTNWVLVAGMAARHGTDGTSSYKRRVRITRGGVYRVYAGVNNGALVPNTGREITIHTFR